MNMTRFPVFVAVVISFLAGCATVPLPVELDYSLSPPVASGEFVSPGSGAGH